MLGNLHVRFGERDGETSLRKGIWRFISTLQTKLFRSREGFACCLVEGQVLCRRLPV